MGFRLNELNDNNKMNFHVDISRKIYKCLQDEESKRIFKNKLLYFYTDDFHFMDDIILSSSKRNDFCNERTIWHDVFAGKHKRNIIVYGSGTIGQMFINSIGMRGRQNITAFCDRDVDKQRSQLHGLSVISLEALEKKYHDHTVVIAIGDSSVVAEITNKLLQMGFASEQLINFNGNAEKFFFEDIQFEYSQSQYFDKDIMCTTSHDEVFIDAGCLDFTTSRHFIDWCGGSYGKIIAFEPNHSQYLVCVENAKGVKNVEIYPNGVWNKSEEIKFSSAVIAGGASISDSGTTTIKTVTIDDVLNGEKATFIKMDVEGSELNALRGSEETILKYRPKLAISLYHKPEDLWELPSFILSLHNDYKLYLRHYSNWEHETILYAV